MKGRLQKILAKAGVASRRTCEKYIEEGRVTVNGEVVTTQGVKVDTEIDEITFDQQRIKLEDTMKYYMLNKPIYVITSAADEKNRETVIDIVNVKERVYPVGRLDYMSCGLLLLTNDGDLTYKLTHPKHVIHKKYIAKVTPKVTKEAIKKLEKGGDIGPYSVSRSKIKLVKEEDDAQFYEVIIHEGKNRQIRNMFESIGAKVTFLRRIEVGEIKLGDLKEGQYRELTKEEVKYLKEL